MVVLLDVVCGVLPLPQSPPLSQLLPKPLTPSLLCVQILPVYSLLFHVTVHLCYQVLVLLLLLI